MRASIRRRRRRGQLRDRGEQLPAIADGRDADLPQVLRRYVSEDLLVDPVLAKSGLVLPETEIAKPPPDVHSPALKTISIISRANWAVRL